MITIFFSHSHHDKDFVRRLGVDLQRLGASVWFDEREIGLGESIVAKVKEGLETADYVGVVLSPHSVASHWVQRELEAAITDENNTGRTKVLSLLLADCDKPVFLRGRRSADFRGERNYANGVTQIAQRLGLYNADVSQTLT